VWEGDVVWREMAGKAVSSGKVEKRKAWATLIWNREVLHGEDGRDAGRDR
jgi:hypothetical protein